MIERAPRPRVFTCPDGRVAVDLSYGRWLMVDGAGFMAVAIGELTKKAVELLPIDSLTGDEVQGD